MLLFAKFRCFCMSLFKNMQVDKSDEEEEEEEDEYYYYDDEYYDDGVAQVVF